MQIAYTCWTILLIVSLLGCGSSAREEGPEFIFGESSIPPLTEYGDYGSLWGDFNNDGLEDLIFMGHGAGPQMLAQRQDHSFQDVTNRSGIKNSDWEYPQQSDRHGASCSDFDNDGNLDLYIAHGARRGETTGIKYDELLQGNGDFTFTDITHSAGALNRLGRGRSGVWFDYNNDGWLDLYALNYLSNNVLYRNNGDSTFTDVTAESGLELSGSRAAPADYDQDGDVDILMAWPLRLLRNDGLGQFVEVVKPEFRYQNLFAYGIDWGDPDNDGDLDIFVSRLGNKSMLLINDGLGFTEHEVNAWSLPEDVVSTGVSWGDMDNDGLLDLVNIRSDGYYIYRNEGVLSFARYKLDAPKPEVVEAKNGDAALADYNLDGSLDIATDDTNGYMLLKSLAVAPNNWLKLKFDGRKNNKLGFGNKIWISSEGQQIAFREYTGSNGSLRSVSCAPIHIGLGQHSEVDLRIKWLDGTITLMKSVDVNQELLISDS